MAKMEIITFIQLLSNLEVDENLSAMIDSIYDLGNFQTFEFLAWGLDTKMN